MTNAIEQAKREMYASLAHMKNFEKSGMIVGCDAFEIYLESYLELLRQDHEALHETSRKRFEDLQAAEALNNELQESRARQANAIKSYEKGAVCLHKRLAAMTEERDSIQLRLHAVDHAYREQQDKIHPCLVEEKGLQDDWNAEYKCDSGKPRKCLHDACKARKNAISMMQRENGDRVSCEAVDVNAKAIQGAAEDIRKISDAWAMTGRRAKKSMLKISGILARPDVYAALEAIEKPATCQHSFFAIGDDQMKCTFCGVGK